MKAKIQMHHFICSTCEVVNEMNNFIENWFETNGNPCLICNWDKSACSCYQDLIERGAIVEEV